MEEMIESLYNFFINNNIVKISSVSIMLFWLSLYVATNDYRILYIMIVGGFASYYFLMGIIYLHKKGRRGFDIEIAVTIAFLDYIIRFYFPGISLINNIIMFSFILLFLTRELKLSVKRNIFFLVSYGVFYFIVSCKFIASLKHSVPIVALFLIIMLTIVLSMVFAYSLLATATVRNFYRCSYCGALAILCIIVLGRRVVVDLDNTKFMIAMVSCLFLLAMLYMYWYEGKEYYMEISGIRKKYVFYPGVLPNLVGVTTFFLYIFKIDLDELLVVWGLLIVVSLWYLISIVYSIKGTTVFQDEAIICEELSEYQLKRLGKYAGHMRNHNFLKKNGG